MAVGKGEGEGEGVGRGRQGSRGETARVFESDGERVGETGEGDGE